VEGGALQQEGGRHGAGHDVQPDEGSAIVRRALPGLLLALAACQKPVPATPEITADSVARLAVDALARRDIDSLAALAHPTKGIRFTPYTYVDTTVDRRLTPAQLRAEWARPDSVLWGTQDGSGDPIRMTFRGYIDRYVYDFDARRAPRVARDSAPMGTGNSLYNLPQIYSGATIVEFNTPGTDPRYGGMDWRSLWVVLERLVDRWVVIGLVRGAWTT
jgi:hypothetical protein